MRRYNRRVGRRGKLPAGAIVGIVAAVALIAAIVAGNILNSCLDDDTYRRLTEGDTGSEETTEAPQIRRSPQVQAEVFRLGTSLRTLGDNPPQAVSIPLNDENGKPLYTSPVVSYLGLETVENALTSVRSRMENLAEEVPHLIGIWHATLPKNAGEEVIYAAAASDAAVLREFLSMGGTELLLTDLRLDNDFEAAHSYLSALRKALGQDAVLSVAVPLSVAESETGRDILYALGRSVPFLTLDLRAEADVGPVLEAETTDSAESGTVASPKPNPESPLVRAQFYLSAYRMRLLLSPSQTVLLSSARASATDFAVR